MTTIARMIEVTRTTMAPLALRVVAYADPGQARREALATAARLLRDDASVVYGSDAFVLIGTGLILLLIVAQRLAHAPQF
jgi:hypothetical protein